MRADRRVAFALAAGLAMLALSIVSGRERASAASRPRLSRPLRTVVVAHLPDRLRTFARVDVARLRCGRPCGVATRRITSRASLARIAASLERVGAHPARSGFDARWLVTATDSGGRRFTIACDRFGRTGTIDGRPVAFSNASPFLEALRRELTAAER